ncbi:MAG: efflux RND transporter periplasmic adaptor subunit [Opitutae bacterium]|nr:efflux RND transporter periplasmic adaptor subunit [Opitutae bacterium]
MSSRSKLPRWLVNTLRILLSLVLLAGLVWGGFQLWRIISPSLFGNKRDEVVPTTKVRIASIAEEIIAVGRIRAVFSTELRSEINGRIIKITGVDGKVVTKGEEILRLDQQDLLTQVQEAERSIEAARLKAQKARRDYSRLAELDKRSLTTPKDMEDARTAQALADNDASIAESRAANLRDRLTKTIIRAPHDGTLLLRDLTEGQVITGVAAQNGGTMLGEVADLSALMVRTNINEIDVARLRGDDPAKVRIDPLGNVILDGVVKRIATSALESAQDRTRIFPVDVVLQTPEPRLRPGMSSTITFTLSRVDKTPAVLLSAVFATADAGRYVFVKTPEGFTVRPVETGIADTRRVQILSGLAENEEVALTRPLDFLGEIPGSSGAVSDLSRRKAKGS